MALTVTNTDTLRLLNIINRTTTEQSNSLTRLSTGLRINKGADDPAGLIALRSLESELTAVDTAIGNGQRADAMLGVADSALTEVSSLLTEIQTLVSASTSSAGLSPTEIAANQAQIDAAIDSIDRIVRTTSFNGKRLLDGNFAIGTTGVTASQIADVNVYSRGNATSDVTFTVDVTTAAARASHTLVDTAGNATSGATSFALAGTLGTTTINVASGSSASDIATQINLSKDLTGLSASVSSNEVTLSSTGYGSGEFISVDVLSGGEISGSSNTFTETSGNVTGTDATVLVNGQATSVDGLTVNFNGNGYSLAFTMTEGFGTQTSTDATFTVSSSGGATFQLGTDSTTRSTIGINPLFSYKLGGGDSGGVLSDLKSGGAASLLSDVATAQSIVGKAVTDVAQAQGRIGGFQKFQVNPTINSLNAVKTGLTDAKSVIADTDYAVETAELNRQNVLLNSAIALLGLANQQSAGILSLLIG
jgi:flagellin